MWHVISRSGVEILIMNCYICVCFFTDVSDWDGNHIN